MIFTRLQLFDLVWTKPITQLAKEYGYSDVALSKICRKHQIPLPLKGYWEKVNAGVETNKPKLDLNFEDYNIDIPFKKTIDVAYVAHKRAKLHLKAEAASNIEQTILQNQSNLIHKKTLITQKFFVSMFKKIALIERSNNIPDDYFKVIQAVYRGRIRCKQYNCFHLSVSEGLIDRALKILNTLAFTLEQQGFKIQSANDKGPVVAIKNAEIVEFWLSEGYKYQNIKPMSSESKLDQILYPDRKPIANGKLTLSISSSQANITRSWSDGKRNIEAQLSNVILEFIEIVPLVKQAKIDKVNKQQFWHDVWKTLEQDQLIRNQEKSLYEEVINEAALFKKSLELECYLKYLELKLIEHQGNLNEKSFEWFTLIRKISRKQSVIEKRIMSLIDLQ